MSKLPSLAVAVCAAGPLLVQVTVSPTWTVIVPGVNTKSEIVSEGSPAKCATTVRDRVSNGLLPAAFRSERLIFLTSVRGLVAARGR